mmetsp:Transcript_5117/g.9713  ORF Transcript_5117/g.9713 Transcript_5117/m.9713 type:complete len:1115 (-) Transcript_5117:1699-5043(-)
MRSRRSNLKNEEETVEMEPIMISESEDEMEIDASDLELNRISEKYRKRVERRSKVVRVLTAAATFIILLSLFSLTYNYFPDRAKDGNTFIPSVPSHPAFGITRSKYLSTYNATMYVFKHQKTQAEFMAFVPADEKQDKVFGISFRTKPTSNTGVAHILEHSVLAGSKKYPAKDPFVILLKGSLHTFLNAMTYNDRTVYPVASRNKKDFFNLMSVYLDAVFAPRCITQEGEWILRQEGWRYDVNDDNNLEIKGVVYSEMKGVFSNPISLISRNVDKFLFPDNTYYFDSGGEPDAIPNLTQAEFVDFYKRHYHPTNSQSFVSGTVEDVIEAMELLDEYMKEYEYSPELKENSEIRFQKKKYAHHLYQSLPYAVQKLDESQGQHMLTITWLLNDSHLHQMQMLAWYALDYLLVGTSSSPLMKRLFESGLGSSVIGNGLNAGLMQNTFAIGMKGILASNITQVEDLILQILRDIERDGFSDDEITAAINSLEFQLREVQSGSNPAGIDIFLSTLTTWNYDRLPEEAIVFDESLASLQSIVGKQGSNFFTRMIKTYLLNNNHRVHMELHPSETLAAEMIEKETNKVKMFQNSLKQDELKKIKDTAQELKDIQNKDDPIEVIESIPSLALTDIDRLIVEYDTNVIENAYGTSTILTKNIVSGSSGIVYLDVGIDISSLGFNNVEVLPFLVAMMTENDTAKRTRKEINNFIGINTGGIGIELKLIALQDPNQVDHIATANKNLRTLLFFRGKCTAQNVGKTLELIKDMAQKSLPVTQEKAIQILEAQIASFESRITSNGHSFSVMRMHARYNAMSFIDEKLRGISQLQALKKMLARAQNSWETFETRIKTVIESFSHMASAETIINLTGDFDTLESIENNIQTFIVSLDLGSNRPPLPDFSKSDHPWIVKAGQNMAKYSPVQNEGIPVSSRVSYIGKGGRIFDEGEKISGGSCVPLQFLRKGYLWDTVRAKNGAYGVMSSLDSTDGFLYMVSYRDPQLIKTVAAYEAAAQYLQSQIQLKALTKNAIKLSIIGCIADLDGSTLPPREVGWLAFLRYMSGSSKLRRQRWRDDILAADESNFEIFAKQLNKWNSNSTLAVIAPMASIEEAPYGQNGLPFNIIQL